MTRLKEALDAGRFEAAVDCHRGELLTGLHVPAAGEAFEEWLSHERRQVTALVLRAMTALAEREEQANNFAAATYWAQRSCALAPDDESRLREEMALLGRAGNTGEALRLYETYARRLASEFDATPSAETAALAARIRNGSREAVPLQEPPTPPAPVLGKVEASEDAPMSTVSAEMPNRRTDANRRARRARAAFWTVALGMAAVAVVLGVYAARGVRLRTHVRRTRVLVTVFDNRTGDSTLQMLGRMTQDWLAQGLIRTDLVDVVDPRATLVQDRQGGTIDPVELARRTGAAMVVSGSYYRTGDTLFAQAAVMDVPTAKIVRVVGPILSSVHTPIAALNELRSRVMSALTAATDLRATQNLFGIEPVPLFEAYQPYVEGWDAYWHGDSRHAEALFLQAARRDSSFTAAALAAATAAANSNDCSVVDSLSRALDARREELDRVHRLSLRIADARCRGRNDEMLQLTLERADLEPGNSSSQMSAAAAALWANRPKRALELFERVDPATDLAWSTDTTHAAYWGGVTEALHLLGRHREELATTERMPPGAPLDRAWLRGTALAALSRPTAVLALIDSSLSLPSETAGDIGLAPYTEGRPEYTFTPAWVANWISRELSVHGDTVAARQAAMRAVAWYRSRPAPERATPEERLVAAWSLEMLGAYREAEHLAEQLIAEDSTNVDFQGELAGLAAEQGDTILAESLDRWLAAQPVARVSWTASIYRARVAATLGHKDEAMARIREALEEGAWPRWLDQEPALNPLRSRPDFMALTAPRN